MGGGTSGPRGDLATLLTAPYMPGPALGPRLPAQPFESAPPGWREGGYLGDWSPARPSCWGREGWGPQFLSAPPVGAEEFQDAP